jgi:parvulin-like peptidyl-prolyl isomerase
MRLFVLIVFFLPFSLFAQTELVDKIVAVVGDEAVLHSDIQSAILEASQGKTVNSTLGERCSVIESHVPKASSESSQTR